MMLDNKTLKEFGSIEALHLFLREQINDGEQISKGKLGNDDSKEKKKAEADEKKLEKPEPGEEPEADTTGPDNPMGVAAEPAGEEPLVDPVGMPGSQVQMGGITKDDKKDKVIDNPDAVEIDLSGKKEKINLKPSMDLNTVK